MEARLYNPDGLPVADVVEQAARLILIDAKLAPHALAGRLFVFFWQSCQGNPGAVATSLRALGREFCDDSPSNIRKALRRLERAELLSLPNGKLQGEFTIGIRRAAPKTDAQQELFERAAERQKASLAVHGAQDDSHAPAVRTDSAHSECAPAVRTASAQRPPPSDENNSTPEDLDVKALSNLIERKRAAAAEPTARKLLECSNTPNIPTSHISSDIPNTQEGSGDVEKVAKAGNVTAARTTEAERFARLRERIERKLGINGRYRWMADSAAMLVVDGPLSEATVETALESAPKWKLFTGAMRNQLAECDQAALVDRGLWDAEKGCARFPHRWPELRKCARRRGITLDESHFPPKKPKPR